MALLKKAALAPAFILLSFFLASGAFAQVPDAFFRAAPQIESLSHRDPLFRQYSDDVRKARMALASEKGEPLAERIAFYLYKAKEGDDLLFIAARSSVPYESIATLNRIENASEAIDGRTLVLPSMPGLYIPQEPKNPFEELLAAELSAIQDEGIKIAGGAFVLFAGRQLAGTSRTFFLVQSMRFPLHDAVLTSSFGSRINPVTGNAGFHRGIDLAAPEGTPVYACAPGTVLESAYNDIYGNYIIIKHSGGRESLYGHLSKKRVELRDNVNSDTIIGNVGSTGQSTGPHLHFEIHENGVPRNPAGLLR